LRHPANPRMRELVNRTLADPRLAATRVGHVLRIGGVRERAKELTDASGDSEPGIVLEGTLPYPVSPDLVGEPVTVDVMVAGVPMRTFTGTLAYVDTEGSFRAATAGRHTEEVKLRSRTSYSSSRPSDAAYAAIRPPRIPYAGVQIPRVDTPLFTRTGADSFPATAVVGQVLEAIREESGLWVFDDDANRARGILLPTLDEPGEPAVHWRQGTHFRAGDFTAELEEEGRYESVLVFGDVGDGEILELSKVDVPYRRGRPPQADSVYEIQTEDPDSAKALALALKTARALSRGLWNFSISPAFFDPRIERCFDTLAWTTTHREGARTVARTWRGRPRTLSRNYLSRRVTYSGTALVYEETGVPATTTSASLGRSRGVVAAA
jgi:hypothetical protein